MATCREVESLVRCELGARRRRIGAMPTDVLRPRVAVVLDADQDVTTWRIRYEAGHTLDRTPYGYDLAADAFDLDWTVSPSRERAWTRRLRRRVAAIVGFDVVHVWRN